MKIYKTYTDIESTLYKKVVDLANNNRKDDIELFVVDSNGNWVDTICFGKRKFFCHEWIIIGNDISNMEIDFSDAMQIINPLCVCMDVHQKEIQKMIHIFIEKHGFEDKSKNCYTFDDPLR